MSRIKYTKNGISYVDITPLECLLWGGSCICNGCGKIKTDLKLVHILSDTYCADCFSSFVKRSENMNKEDLEHDLKLQEDNDVNYYKHYVKID